MLEASGKRAFQSYQVFATEELVCRRILPLSAKAKEIPSTMSDSIVDALWNFIVRDGVTVTV